MSSKFLWGRHARSFCFSAISLFQLTTKCCVLVAAFVSDTTNIFHLAESLCTHILICCCPIAIQDVIGRVLPLIGAWSELDIKLTPCSNKRQSTSGYQAHWSMRTCVSTVALICINATVYQAHWSMRTTVSTVVSHVLIDQWAGYQTAHWSMRTCASTVASVTWSAMTQDTRPSPLTQRPTYPTSQKSAQDVRCVSACVPSLTASRWCLETHPIILAGVFLLGLTLSLPGNVNMNMQ